MDDEEPPQLLEAEPEAGPSSPTRNFDRPKVPITLLTGYLGAGKSTLLEYILTADHGYRIAVCMNDFGDTTDIEAKALTLSDPTNSTTSTEFLSLPNGCLCCSVKDLGIAAIEDMVANAPGGVDWVVVELTGVADPAPIVRTFWANEEMGDLILDGVICVVDSRNVLHQLDEEKAEGGINECQKQVACADVILLNKLDLVSPEHLSRVESTIRSLNPTLRVHRTTNSRGAPLKDMFNIRAFSDSAGTGVRDVVDDRPAGEVVGARGEACAKGECNGHDHEHGHAHGEDGETHHSRITTALIPLPPLSDAQYSRLTEFLESLLWELRYPAESGGPTNTTTTSATDADVPEILRTKGYIPLQDGREFVLQGVADLFELKELEARDRGKEGVLPSGEGEGAKRGKVVFIGRGVDGEVGERLKRFVGL
ncbi:hypothetical protein IAT38_005264 [Cryptococcus sp. DSM 104549]